ncbi:serine hydrolase [Arenibacter sp. GZD96]|uniref:serine hydrolase n=1 Tax=Aurantibrevibacter litoralis TaxID=3106030 RepID=UPI002AFFC39A|nr:serine hydrolase [Arenibacter sp. GZD-96]MEA1786235.1 serine hydrolase [Arenibacter sp. GZD-96]
MAYVRIISYVLLLFLGAACQKKVTPQNPLDAILSSTSPHIKKVMDSLDQYEVQIRYTQIDRKNDSVIFTDYDFQVDADTYFYPASTVKFPIAVLALEKLNAYPDMNLYTRFYIEGDSVETTFANDVSKIFAVSDNDANNRLFEFLGQDTINQNLEKKELFPVRIAHRLSAPDSDNLTTKPLVIYVNDSTTTLHYPITNEPLKPLHINGLQKGIAYYDNDSLVRMPFNFSLKNYYPIATQDGVLKRIFFPETFKPSERFNLTTAQLNFIRNAMHTLPEKLGYPPAEYYDSYGKFFLFGDSKEKMPEHIKIYNKVGYAYGTLTDCAYITDFKNGVEFLLTATILVNKNGVFNDNTYEYDDVGIPFLAELGRQVYAHELERKRKN